MHSFLLVLAIVSGVTGVTVTYFPANPTSCESSSSTLSTSAPQSAIQSTSWGTPSSPETPCTTSQSSTQSASAWTPLSSSTPIYSMCKTLSVTIDHWHTVQVPITIEHTKYVTVTVYSTEVFTSTVPTTIDITETFLSAETDFVIRTTELTVPTTVISDETIFSTQTVLSLVTLTTTIEQNVTFTTTASGQTFTITTPSLVPTTIVSTVSGPIQTSVETSLEEGPTVTKTVFPSSSTPAPTCSNGCEVDVTATLVSFPGQVSTSTVTYFTRSIDVFITGLPDGTNKTSYVTATLPNPPISSSTSAITWTFNSVVLTYPTTYVAYIDFSHIFAVPVSTGCLTATEKLVLPSPTDFAPLIFPSASVSESEKPPSTLISYLNSLPTVLVQLSGTPIGSSCDPIVGGTTTAQVASTAVGVVSLISVAVLDAATSTHYSLVQEDTGKPAPPLGASTPAPPPPSSTAALPQSFAPASSSPAPAPTTQTSAPPPVPASSTVTVAAAHPRADMRHLGLEGWLIGAAGLGLGWL